jgi:hypothetical protein
MSVQTANRRSRALPAEIKAMRAIKREVDRLGEEEKRRVGEWIGAYIEGVGVPSASRYRMALEAILLLGSSYADDGKRIAKAALHR